MKQLKVIKDPEQLDGYCMICEKGYMVYINIEKLWKNSKTKAPKHTEDRFIREFANTYAHELLHVEIKKIEHKYDYGEERIIYNMLGDKWYKGLDTYYKSESNI